MKELSAGERGIRRRGAGEKKRRERGGAKRAQQCDKDGASSESHGCRRGCVGHPPPRRQLARL